MVVQISLFKKEKHIQLTTVKFKIWVYFLIVFKCYKSSSVFTQKCYKLSVIWALPLERREGLFEK